MTTKKLKTLGSCLIIAQNMSTTKSTSDGWGPYGPPSSWPQIGPNKEHFKKDIARWEAELKANPGQLPRCKTATELFEEEEEEERAMAQRAYTTYKPT
jgi:hypothetical protein